MTITIARRELERPVHPRAIEALSHILEADGYDHDDAALIADSVGQVDWVVLPNGRRELRDMADSCGLLAFFTIDEA